MLLVTTLTASVLAIFYVRLTFNVIRLRQKLRISLGTGGNADLERAIRAHGNFSEYVPIALILLGCLEINLAPALLVGPMGALLIGGRVVHAIGVNTPSQGAAKNRVRGMVITILTMVALVTCNLGWLIYKQVV
jgi:uncharacterized membrane protein YecN with MAPEG domain